MAVSRTVSVQQAAEEIGVHAQTIRNYVHKGYFRAVKMGQLLRIDRESLEAFILKGNPEVCFENNIRVEKTDEDLK